MSVVSERVLSLQSWFALLILALLTALASEWPSLWWFSTDTSLSKMERLLASPVHLDDDVMISLRPGYMLQEIGVPSFNRTDLSQPSTSYLTPYLFSLLLMLFPLYQAVLFYSALGYLAVIGTLYNIMAVAKFKSNGILLAAALTLTTTNFRYAANGWDHLFQGYILTLATLLIFKHREGILFPAVVTTLLFLAVVSRPDAMIIALSLLLFYAFTRFRSKTITTAAFALFGFYLLLLAVVNLHQFDSIFTTTTRLKVGAAPSAQYALEYIIETGLLAYSSLTVVILGLATCLFYRNSSAVSKVSLILFALTATCVIAALNSDVFVSGRMFWSSSCVLLALIGAQAPKLFDTSFFVSDPTKLISSAFTRRISYRQKLFLVFTIIIFTATILVSSFATTVEKKFRVESLEKSVNSPLSKQFVLIDWIKNTLDNDAGAIGLFHVGMGFHLRSFEIADFLGKADELIATGPVQWGPPGHNKWNIDATIKKWNPQVIVPPINSDFSKKQVQIRAQTEMLDKQGVGGFADLIVSQTVKQNYVYCYLFETSISDYKDYWGFFVRKDIASVNSAALSCFESNRGVAKED